MTYPRMNEVSTKPSC